MAKRKRDLSQHLKVISLALLGSLLIFFILTQPWKRIQQSQLSNASKTSAAETNLLRNHSFETAGNPIANWMFRQAGDGEGTLTRDTTAVDGSYSAKIDVIDDDGGEPWNVQLQQAAAITAGQTYIIRYHAKASTNRTIHVAVQQSYSPWNNYFARTQNITTNWQQYSHQFTASGSDTINMQFNLAEDEGQIWIDNAQLNLITQNTPLPTSPPTPKPTINNGGPTPQPTSQTATPIPSTIPQGGEIDEELETDPEQNSGGSGSQNTQNNQSNGSNNIPFEQRTITVDRTNIQATLNKQNAVNGKVSLPAFTIHNDNVSMWNLKYITPANGYTFSPQTHISSPGDHTQVNVQMNTTLANRTYTGQIRIQYFKNNAWRDGPLVSYSLTLTGTAGSTAQRTSPARTRSPAVSAQPTGTQAPPLIFDKTPQLTLISPRAETYIPHSKNTQVRWQTDIAEMLSTVSLYKEINSVKKGNLNVPNVTNSRNGINTYALDTSTVLPGPYQLAITLNPTAKTPDVASHSIAEPITLGSKLEVFAARKESSSSLPNLQILVKGKVVKTIYGVQGNADEEGYMQYTYYSSEKMSPAQVQIKQIPSTAEEEKVVIEKIIIDGTVSKKSVST